MIKINRRAVVILLTGLSCGHNSWLWKKEGIGCPSSKVLPITVAAPSNDTYSFCGTGGLCSGYYKRKPDNGE